MQKYENDRGVIGVEDMNRWPADSDAVSFLSMTTSAGSVDELKKVSTMETRVLSANSLQHVLVRRPWRKEDLELLEELASLVRRPYRRYE